MKRFDKMTVGLFGGLLAPVLAFIVYFKIHDSQMSLADVLHRLIESKVISYYVSLCAIANLAVFFFFLRLNADHAARGVLGATIVYAFIVLFLKLK